MANKYNDITYLVIQWLEEYLHYSCEEDDEDRKAVIANPEEKFNDVFEPSLDDKDSVVFKGIWKYGYINIDWDDVADYFDDDDEECSDSCPHDDKPAIYDINEIKNHADPKVREAYTQYSKSMTEMGQNIEMFAAGIMSL